MAAVPQPAPDHPLIGTIVEVHGPVVDIACDTLPALHRALYTFLNDERFIFEVHRHLDERHVRAITLHRTSGLYRGMPVYDSGAPVHVPVSEACLGRLLNVFGEPLDGGAPLQTSEYRNILAKPAPLYQTTASHEILQLFLHLLVFREQGQTPFLIPENIRIRKLFFQAVLPRLQFVNPLLQAVELVLHGLQCLRDLPAPFSLLLSHHFSALGPVMAVLWIRDLFACNGPEGMVRRGGIHGREMIIVFIQGARIFKDAPVVNIPDLFGQSPCKGLVVGDEEQGPVVFFKGIDQDFGG